jgi:hemerythrin-like domain-containing protein
LFPLAERVIPLEWQEQLAEQFEHIEHEETGAGVHEKYLAMVDKLASEAAGLAVSGRQSIPAG